MADEFKYDVFVSYSSANKDWVRKTFVPLLENAGLKVCDYYRDFDVGAPIVMEMERAILESHKTIPVFSPAYLKSGWAEFESLMLQTLDAANRERHLLPVILESCELPLRIKYMNCINFANPDDVEIEWQRLSRALGVTLSSTITPKIATTADWHLAHPYPMPPNFTGRVAEQKMLDDWLANDKDRLFILRALGGFGKSALSWQWINTHVNPAEWTKLVWWSFYEGDASFEHFIEETLKYLKLEVPQGGRSQVDELLKAMQSQKILLIMDGFERALRAYSSMSAAYQGDEEPKLDDNQLDCVNVDAECFLKSVCSLPNLKSKVLTTTRLTPRAIKPRGEFMLGCREEELTSMQIVDVVEFFRKQQIRGTYTEIEAACASYGHHPLSLRLLAGRILKDFGNPADIIVAQKLKIDGDFVQQKHHVLVVSYESLPKSEQKILSTIACFRSPVELKTLQSIAENIDTLDADLHDLLERGLLHFDGKNKKFDLHPIVRRYAYERLTALDRTAAHTRLIHYFDAVPKPEKVNKLEDLAPVIELYHHMVRAGSLDEAVKLFFDRLNKPLYYQLGAYQVFIELLSALFDEKIQLPRLKDESFQAQVLNNISNAYSLSGQPRRAVLLFEQAIKLGEAKGDKKNLAIRLGNVANMAQIYIGALSAAERNLRRGIEIDIEIQDNAWEAENRRNLAIILSYNAKWRESEEELNKAISLFEKTEQVQGQVLAWSSYSLHFLLMAREQLTVGSGQLSEKSMDSAIECAQRALELADETAKTLYSHPRDYVRAELHHGKSYFEG